MDKAYKWFVALVLALILCVVCALAAYVVYQFNEAQTTKWVTATPFAVSSQTEDVTSQPASWLLPDPPDANRLPTELLPAIAYIQPPQNCAAQNDPNLTCSTLKGQVTDGDFILGAGNALVMTGDAIGIFKDNEILVDQPSLDTNHDLWVVVNTTGSDLKLHMMAPYGSFRGYFEPVDGRWNVQKIAHLRNLHLYLFLLPPQTYDRFTPTPVPNCESYYGCEKVNVRVLVYDETGLHVAGYGLYSEGQPFWQSLLQLLGQ